VISAAARKAKTASEVSTIREGSHRGGRWWWFAWGLEVLRASAGGHGRSRTGLKRSSGSSRESGANIYDFCPLSASPIDGSGASLAALWRPFESNGRSLAGLVGSSGVLVGLTRLCGGFFQPEFETAAGAAPKGRISPCPRRGAESHSRAGRGLACSPEGPACGCGASGSRPRRPAPLRG